jgi:hypothetical protein
MTIGIITREKSFSAAPSHLFPPYTISHRYDYHQQHRDDFKTTKSQFVYLYKSSPNTTSSSVPFITRPPPPPST